MLVHNAFIVHVSAVCLMLLASRTHKLHCRFMSVLIMGIISLAPWIVMRILLGQFGSHSGAHKMVLLHQRIHESVVGIGEYYVGTSHYFVVVRFAIGAGLLLSCAIGTVLFLANWRKTEMKVMFFAMSSYTFLLLIFKFD